MIPASLPPPLIALNQPLNLIGSVNAGFNLQPHALDVTLKTEFTGQPVAGGHFTLRKDKEGKQPIAGCKDLISNDRGAFSFPGLTSGTYWIVETPGSPGIYETTGPLQPVISVDESGNTIYTVNGSKLQRQEQPGLGNEASHTIHDLKEVQITGMASRTTTWFLLIGVVAFSVAVLALRGGRRHRL